MAHPMRRSLAHLTLPERQAFVDRPAGVVRLRTSPDIGGTSKTLRETVRGEGDHFLVGPAFRCARPIFLKRARAQA